MMRLFLLILLSLVCALAFAQAREPGAKSLNGLRGSAALDREPAAPSMPRVVNDDVRRGRAYAMQPPVIPHQIDNYQVDKNFNKCMTCHGRERIAESQAPMVSVTHFMDRDNNFRSEISPRRYFCTQCHVSQHEVSPMVTNTFVDAEKARTASTTKGKSK